MREREREVFVVPLIYVFICCFLYAPWLGIKPTTSAYGDDALTKWASPARAHSDILILLFLSHLWAIEEKLSLITITLFSGVGHNRIIDNWNYAFIKIEVIKFYVWHRIIQSMMSYHCQLLDCVCSLCTRHLYHETDAHF